MFSASQDGLTQDGPTSEAFHNVLERQGSLFAQYAGLELLGPHCKWISSRVHAGPGEVAFGSTRRQLADVTACVGEGRLVVLNYHGAYYHYSGHFANCPLRNTYPEETPEISEETELQNSFNKRYAAALSSVDPASLTVTYRAYFACDLFHGKKLPPCSSGRTYDDLRVLLEREHPEASVLGFPRKTYSEDLFLSEVLMGNLTGFVALEGGEETAEDKVSTLFSFVPQRSCVPESEMGSHTRKEIELAAPPGEHQRYLKKYANTPYTLTKHYADTEKMGPLVMSTTLFSWLVRERGFRRYKVLHFLAYRFRDYLRPFLHGSLVRRLREKQPGGCELTAGILKLLANSFYGYTSLNLSNYSRTVLHGEESLRKHPEYVLASSGVALLGCRKKRTPRSGSKKKDDLKRRKGRRAAAKKALEAPAKNRVYKPIFDEDGKRVGCERRQVLLDMPLLTDSDSSSDPTDNEDDSSSAGKWEEKWEEKPELLFALTKSNDNASIQNLVQVAVAILSNSKVIFLGHIKKLLDLLSTKKAELCYLDTVGAQHFFKKKIYSCNNELPPLPGQRRLLLQREEPGGSL